MTADALPVLFVSSHARRGGAETYLESLTDELDSAWVAGIVALEHGPLVDRLRGRGGEVVVIETGPSGADVARSAVALRRVVRRTRPAVVHANGVKAALVAATATLGLRTPVVWVKHDYSFDGSLATVAAIGSRLVVGVSPPVVAAFPSWISKRIRVVPNGIRSPGVEPDAGRARLRRLMGVALDAPVVGLVGRFHPLKGHDDLLRAAVRVRDRVTDVRLAFLGGPDVAFPSRPRELQDLAERLGVSGLVSWLGYHESPFELMTGFDVAVMPTKPFRGRPSEGFPMAAVELLALGVPVVGYRRGGTPEALGDCAVLVEPDDTRRLADAIADVLGDAGLRVRMRACGLERAAMLDVASLARRMRALYEEAVG